MYTSTWSRFWEKHALWFIVINGIYLLYANGIFNLCTVAGRKYPWFFFEPIVYVGLLCADNHHMLKDSQCAMLYFAYGCWISVKYLLFMQSIVVQICTYLGIRFLHVKKTKNH